MKPAKTRLSYFAGLDLGQPHEFSALAVLEKRMARSATGPDEITYAVRHLERFALSTPYAAMFDRVAEMLHEPPLGDATLVVDQTGVGAPVLELLRRRDHAPYWIPVTIGAGLDVTFDGHGGWVVPKLDLIGALQVLLQAKRLKVAESLTQAGTLVRELMNFQVKPLSANTTDPLATWREGQHDDLVFAVALAVWQGERHVDWDVQFLGELPAVLWQPAWLAERRLGRW